MNKKLAIFNCLNYAMFGDIIGFKNGKGKYNKDFEGVLTKNKNPHDYIELSSIQCNYMLFKYVNDNMFNSLEQENEYYNYIPSSITIAHLIIAEEIINKNKNTNCILNIKNKLLNYYNKDNSKDIRDYPSYFKYNLENNNKQNYEINQYLSNYAASTMIIGIVYNNYEEIINFCFELGFIFNKNGIGILGGICSALFTNFLYNNIDIDKWIPIMLKLLKQQNVKKLFNLNKKYILDLELFIDNWEKYYNLKFKNKKYILYSIAFYEPSNRYQYYFNNFSNNKDKFYPGDSGSDCMIIVYDLLIDSKLNISQHNKYSQLEKLIIKSILHTGNTSNIASIVLCLYGITNNNDNDNEKNDNKLINKILISQDIFNKKIKKIFNI